jgi:protein subunit release factor A
MDESELRIDVWRHAQVGSEVRVRVTHLPSSLSAEATGQGEFRMRQAALTALGIALAHNAKLAEIDSATR